MFFSTAVSPPLQNPLGTNYLRENLVICCAFVSAEMNIPQEVREIYSKYLTYPTSETFDIGKGAFAENKWVWVPIAKDKYSVGEIIGESGGKTKVRTQEGEEVTMDKEKLENYLMNPPRFDGVPDNSELSNLSEPAVLHNLKKRYDNDIIYVRLTFLL